MISTNEYKMRNLQGAVMAEYMRQQIQYVPKKDVGIKGKLSNLLCMFLQPQQQF